MAVGLPVLKVSHRKKGRDVDVISEFLFEVTVLY